MPHILKLEARGSSSSWEAEGKKEQEFKVILNYLRPCSSKNKQNKVFQRHITNSTPTKGGGINSHASRGRTQARPEGEGMPPEHAGHARLVLPRHY